jgi:hypothetical protein
MKIIKIFLTRAYTCKSCGRFVDEKYGTHYCKGNKL